MQFLCPVVKQVKTLNFVDAGKIKRIRGIALVFFMPMLMSPHLCAPVRRHAVRVNPQFSNRMIEASRSILNRYIPDIYLYSDVYKGEESGKFVAYLSIWLFLTKSASRSPGYALTLLAESTTSAIHSSEAISQPGVAPEDIALLATRALLQEINLGGCVDRKHQTLVLLLMVMGSEDVGRCRMGEPTLRTWAVYTSYILGSLLIVVCSIQFLRDVKDFFGTSFKIVPAEVSDSSSTALLYSCYGTGYVNVNRTLA